MVQRAFFFFLAPAQLGETERSLFSLSGPCAGQGNADEVVPVRGGGGAGWGGPQEKIRKPMDKSVSFSSPFKMSFSGVKAMMCTRLCVFKGRKITKMNKDH